MDADYRLVVPPEFDDSADEDGQVYPVACRLFTASDPADLFAKAERWMRALKIVVIDVSWKHAPDEPEPYWLSVYFSFDLDSAPADV